MQSDIHCIILPSLCCVFSSVPLNWLIRGGMITLGTFMRLVSTARFQMCPKFVFVYVFAFVFVFVFIFVIEYVFASVFWTLLYIGELEIKCTTAVVSSKWRSSELHFWTFHFSAFRPQTFSAFQPQNFSHIFNRKIFLSVSTAKLFSGFHWCISSPKTQFVFAKNAFYLNLELASPLIPCRFCQLKKVFDLGEMMLRRHFCAARKKFKSRWSSAISHHSQYNHHRHNYGRVCIFSKLLL